MGVRERRRAAGGGARLYQSLRVDGVNLLALHLHQLHDGEARRGQRGREGEGGIDGCGAVGGKDLHVVGAVVAGDLAHDGSVGLEAELRHDERARRELVRGGQAAQRAARGDREGVSDVWPTAASQHYDAPRLLVQMGSRISRAL
eukprot:scaffold86711_cov66-Phaeocystis_antarctica.AAC.1